MRKLFGVVLILMLTIALEGCSKVEQADISETSDSVSDTTEDISGTVVITGSTSVENILNDMIDEFQALHPQVTIEYTGSGSSAGIKDTLAKTNNIGAASREIKEDELEQSNGEMNVTTFAYDGIAVIVNPANTAISNLTIEQLTDIYSGKITNWSEVGGDDEGIFVISREESSGTRSAFEELVELEDAGGLTVNAGVSEGNGPVQAGVAGNPYAIGYVSFSYMDDSVKAVTIDGVEPTVENAQSGIYSLSRPFNFVYFDDNTTEAGAAFLEFALSADGQAYVEENGAVTVE